MAAVGLLVASPFIGAFAVSIVLMIVEWRFPERMMVVSFMHLKWAAPLYLSAFGALIFFWLHEVLEHFILHEALSDVFFLTTGSLLLIRNIVAVAFMAIHVRKTTS